MEGDQLGMTTVSQSEFADILGKDKSYVTRLKQAGRLVFGADGKKVDVEASKARIAETSHPGFKEVVEQREAQKSNPAPPSPQSPQEAAIGNSLQTARAVKEKYFALQAKADYEASIGKLVDAEGVRLFVTDLAATFRCALEILPDRMAAELVPLNDAEAIRAVLLENFEQLLSDLADKIHKMNIK